MAARRRAPTLLALCLSSGCHAQTPPSTSEYFSGPSALSSYLLTNYDKLVPPAQLEGEVTTLQLYPIIDDIESIDAKAQMISFRVSMNAAWIDRRLAFEHLNYSSYTKYVPFIDTKANGWEVWRPPFHFPPCATEDKTTGVLYYAFPNGAVEYTLHLRLTCKCDFQFARMPWHDQKCLIPAILFGLTTETIKIDGQSLRIGKPLTNPSWQEITCTAFTDEYLPTPSTPPFTRLVFTFAFQPIKDGVILSVIVPVVIFVLIAYGGMYITEHPSRTALGITSALIINVVIGKVYGELPSSAMKPWLVDFLYGCLFFNLSAAFLAISVDFSDTQVKRLKDHGGEQQSGLPKLWFWLSINGPYVYRIAFIVCFVIYLIVMFAVNGLYPDNENVLPIPGLPGTYKDVPLKPV